jgi:hypothetical protein
MPETVPLYFRRSSIRRAGYAMRHLIVATVLLATVFLPGIGLAQPAPQFCISPTLAQSLAAALQQDAAMLAMLNDAAQDQARQAAAVAAAVAKQKADDEAAGKKP